MADYGNDRTEEQLEELERRIYETYKLAKEEMQEKVEAYFERFRERDEENRKRLEAGEITEEYYKQWRLAQIGRGQRMEVLRDEYARRMNEANKVSAAYINDTTPGIYSLNENYAAYTIEQVSGNVGFNLINEQAVRRLIVEQPELFYRPVIDTPFDVVWNQKKLTAALTASILQGESIGKIADRFQSVADMNRVSALRNARTAVTSAQNAGRQASYNRAKEMGLGFLRKVWLATKDSRTREAHQEMDGKETTLDGYFTTPLGSIMQHPGDRVNGKPGDIYNCRCRTVTKEKPGIQVEPREMWARNPVTGKSELIPEMTYKEWEAWKQGQAIVTQAAEKYAQGLTMSTNDGILSEEDLYALEIYTGPMSYIINAILRGEGEMTEEYREIIRSIDIALEKMPVYQGTVYRSISSKAMADPEGFWQKYTPGLPINEDQYTSTSTAVYDSTMDIQMVIQSKRGRDLRSINAREKEVLFKRGTMFYVEKKAGNTIWLTEL